HLAGHSAGCAVLAGPPPRRRRRPGLADRQPRHAARPAGGDEPGRVRARRGVIGLDELVGMDVIHGPRRASTATYDRWLQALRATDARFDFTDPPLAHSLPVALAFAATASRPTAVLTGPTAIPGPPPGV